MNRPVVAFLVSAVAGAVLGVSNPSFAATWWRTVHGSACAPYPYPVANSTSYPQSYTCSFPSDQITGATSLGGNGGVTAVYADFVIGESGGKNVMIEACGEGYNLSGGQCGTPYVNASMVNGVYDQRIPLWTGTASPWDYFYVVFSAQPTGYLGPIGFGVAGSD